jgi:UDP-glucose 4-epimerase
MSVGSVLITGSSGTVGTALALRLLDAGCDVHGVDVRPNRWSDRVDERTTIVDLRDAGVELPEADCLIHLAAHARVHRLVQEPKRAMENVDMTFSVLEHARRNDIDRVVFASSREVYGNNPRTVYHENDSYTRFCESPYTASKISGEAFVNSYQQCYGLDSVTLRFSNVYGRFDASDRVVPLFIARAARGLDLTVYGRGKVLDFTYIDDCVEGVFRTVRRFDKVSGEQLNIASGQGYSLLELAEAVRSRLDADVDVSVEPSRTGEVGRFVADTSKARRILGFEPEYDLGRGIERTVEWYRANDHLLDEILDE